MLFLFCHIAAADFVKTVLCYNIYMPYSVGEKGSYGCSGYPVIKDDDKSVMGCHDTAASAQSQIAAINMSEAEQPEKRKKLGSGLGNPEPASNSISVLDPSYEEKEIVANDNGMSVKNPEEWPVSKAAPCWEGAKNKALFSNFGKDWTTSRGLPELFR
jgi:hypothetical protein